MGNRNDAVRREQAYQDYKSLPNFGRKSNPNQLYDWYLERLQKDPTVRPLISTTSRGMIYTWFRDDQWEARLNAEKEEERTAEKAEFSVLRKRALGQLYLYSNEAVDTLRKIMLGGKNDRDKLDAAKAVLDRIGVIAQVANRTSADEKPMHPHANVQYQDTTDMPAEDATDEELTRILEQLSGNRNS